MARYVLSDRGNVTDEDENEEQKKKKKKGSEYVMGDDGIIRLSTQDIAPVKVEHDSFFKSGALEDGYHVGDLSLSLLATAGDTALNVVKGAGSMVEGVTDLLLYGASGLSDLVGADSFADDLKDLAKKSSVNDLLSGAEGITDKYSFFGDKMDSVSQGLGQVGTIILTGGVAGAAGLGAGATTAITTGAMGLSSMGSGMSEAYQANASDEDAFAYGLSKGVIDAGSELIFGGLGKVVNAVGISKGLSSLDDIFAKKLASKLSSQTAKNLVEFGVKASAEGFEEVLAGVGTAAAKHFTYMSDEELSKLLKDEKLLDQFVIGAVTSGISQSGIVPGMKSGSLAEANKTGHDFVTGLTKNEQTVVDKVYADEVAKAEKKGKLSAKEKNKIYDDVLNDLEKGYIKTDTIEEVLGDRSAYDALEKESKEFDTLFNTATGQLSKAQQNRLAELEAKNNENPYKDALEKSKEQYTKSVSDMVKGDRLSESYREKNRVYEDFRADIEKFKGTKHEDAARKTLESAMKAGANNTNRVHDLVDMAAQISADTGRTFEFKSGEQIKNDFVERQTKVIAEMEKIPEAKRTAEQSKKLADLKDLLAKVQSGETVVNGDITSDGIVLNLDSDKPLNRTVGHEVTHSLENAKSYKELKDSLYAYAKSKGIDIDNELNTRKLMYEGVADADPEAELVADLVGDFLFTDSEYVRKLSTENQNVFQKFWDKIKYLCKVATAGSQEARELARVEKAFSDAYREGGKAQVGKQYSLSSMANTFFGDENMTAEQFKKADYRQTQGYKDYVDQCLNNYRQTRADFDEATARKSIEDSIEGIVKVAIAAKQAGYDIYDDSAKRSKKDSKKRLLFSSLEPNSDYFTSSDISTICDKRKNFAEIYDDIVRAEEAKGVPKGKRFFDNVDNYFAIHKIMADKGLTTPCRQCYVESMRKNLAPMANAFLRLVQETNPDNTANDQLYHQKGKQKGEEKTSNAATREFVLSELIAHPEYNMSVNDLTVETLTTADGLAQLKLQAPTIYEAFNSFYGQSKPKMPKGATPFRFGELTALLTDEKGKIKKSVLDKINSTGGFRLQSYSDFQIQNYTDVLQVLFEAGTLGLKGHAYTKVPAFLDATEGTNLKRNISIFMYKDGDQWKLDKNDSFPYDLEEIYDLVKADESGNTGIIAVSQNADMSAWIMANDHVGYGIPFHKSGLKMGTVRDTEVKTEDGRVIKGYSGTIDHTKQQTEVWAKAGDGHKAETKVKNGINIYSFWDFDNKSNLSKNELIEKNVKAYIDQCELAGYLPKFRAYVMNNGKVLNDVLKYAKELGFVGENATIEDISFQYKGYTIPYGYYKFLGDFGMFTPDGKASAQKTLSLENYDFDKAVKFFSDSETLRRNEILQQFANGEERQRYRDSDLTAGELQDIVKQKRREVAESVVGDIAPSMSLSNGGEQFAPTSSFDISGKDFRVKDPTQETVSEIESVVPMQETTDEFSTSAPVAISEEETTTDDIAPMIESAEVQEDIDAPEVVAEDIAPAVEVATPKQQPKKPKSNAKGKERKWVGTSTSSDAVDGKILPEDLDQELTHYQPISNKKTLGNANSKLDSMGYETAVAYMSSQFASNKVSLDDIALGERLIQEAVKRGDTKTAGDLIMDISILGTELGQKVQALSIIKRLTPEGQLRMLQRVVDRGKTKGDKAFEGVEITQEMIDYILKTYGEDGTYNQAELNKRVEDVKQQIADKMKVSAMDYINEWRYLSMLGNPKTHIRNMVSNAAMWATRQAKNAVARTIENIAPIKKRTKTWKRASDDVKAYADQVTAEEYAGESDSKYSEFGSIKAKRRIFKTDAANRIAKFNSDALSGEDTFFSKPAFRESFTEYLTANGIRTKADIENNSKLIAEAKQYAMNQAKEATFQQDSYIASKISEVERRNPLLGVAVGSVMPFKKTPINIAKTAAAYSPLGLARNIYDALQVNKGNMEASEAIDHLAQTLTGTALTLLGFAWARAGFLNGAGDDDKEGEYDYQLGEQSYSFNFNGSTFSLSWLSPVAMPLFVGANAYEQFVAKEDWNWNVVTEALAQTLDPLSEMSFLSSLADVLSSYDSGMAAFGGMIESASQSYITSLVPTLSSQIAQVTDDTKRSTKVAANSGWDFGEETWNKIKYKIPGLRQTLEASTDIWGNEVKQADNVLTRAFESFLAPYARREEIATAVDEEIKALYRETGDTGLIPSVPYNYINYDGEKYEMSAEEFTEFKKAYGQTAFDLMEELFATKTYQNAASETRADMVNKVYDYARDEARRAYFADQGVEFTNATKDGKEYYKPNAIKSAIAADMPVDEYVFSRDYPEKYSFFQENGITYKDYASADEEGKRAYTWASENPGKYEMSKAISDDFLTYWQYKTEFGDLEGDKDANGKTISGSKKSKVISYINDMDLDYGQKIILFKSEYNSDDTYNYDIIEYLNGRDDISYRQMETILKVLGFNVDAQGNITWD